MPCLYTESIVLLGMSAVPWERAGSFVTSEAREHVVTPALQSRHDVFDRAFVERQTRQVGSVNPHALHSELLISTNHFP
jgi:hypothetical protein